MTPFDDIQNLLEHVRRFRSPNCVYVLPVLGASSELADPPYIVAPFVYHGSIIQYLERFPGASRSRAVSVQNSLIDRASGSL